jgi:hypothetical protein
MNDMLKQNATLTNLILQGNNFDDNSATLWADIIAVRLKWKKMTSTKTRPLFRSE